MSIVNTDCFLNIIKRKETILYRTSVPDASANVAYVSGSNISVENSLSIIDKSSILAGNRVLKSDYTVVEDSQSFSTDTEDLAITDIFVTGSNTVAETPLFFKHILSEENIVRSGDSLDIPATTTLLSVEILDYALQPLGVTELYLDEDQGILYNNLESFYDSDDDWDIFYVKYVVNNGTTINTYIDLLSNIPVYQPATFDDLDSNLLILTDGRKVYMVDEEDGNFTITLPISNTYAYKPLSVKLQVLQPTTNNTEDPWYVQISNGLFYADVQSLTRKYYIAEFTSQTFEPEYPFKHSLLEYSTIVNENIIKLDHINISLDSDEDMYMTIEISDENDDGVAAYTTDSSLVGTTAANGKAYQRWTILTPVGIRSIDVQNGFLDIAGLKLESQWTVTSSYYYTETNYVFTSVNFNPISNREVLSTKTILFIDPETTEPKTQTLYYLKVDQSGRVIESNWDGFDNTTQKIANDDWLYYNSKPSWDTKAPWTVFLDRYSAEVSGYFLPLAELTVGVGSSSNDLVLSDSRHRGGGIVDELFTEVLSQYPELGWNWDESNWDGIPYPGNATFLAEVPVSILEGAGGTFTQQEVRDIVERHMAFGEYPVVRAYGVEITMSGVSQSSDELSLEWISHGY